MNRKNNLRAQNTQKKIKKIFLIKLGSKPIKEITVQEICREAEINRTTFYLHFDDIYDLMRDIEVEMQQEINKLFIDTDRGIYKPFTENRLEQLINYLYEHAIFYRILLNDLNRLNIIDIDLAAAWNKELEPALRKRADTSETELQYRFEYFNSGFRGIIRTWLNTNCPESPEKLTLIIKNILQV